MPGHKINFTRNWNGKLDNDIFTTIRKEDYPFKTNDVGEVYVNGVFKKNVTALYVDTIPYEDLNWVTKALDTGYLPGGANKIFDNLGIKEGDKVKVLVLQTIK